MLVGLLTAFLLTRVMESLLFTVQSADPLIFLAGSVVLSVAALLASLIPAVRAVMISPLTALKAT